MNKQSNTKERSRERWLTKSDDYVAHWRELIAATADPRTLLDRWRAERDQRDELAVPVIQRAVLLRAMAPEEV
jgi:hypothetical protein